MTKSIKHQFFFPHPPETVWEYLTKPELMEQWLMRNDFHNAGFISITDIGRERYCTLKKDGFEELQAWIAHFDKFWTSKLKKLEALLNNKLSN